MKALRISQWQKHYETSDSRKVTNLSWVKTPNGHDSLGYCEIISHPNGMAHYGAWNLILQIASKCPIRGLLVSGKSKVHDARSLALVARASEKIVAEAIPRLLSVGWLEEIDLDDDPGKSGNDPDDFLTRPGKSGNDPGKPGLEERRGEERRRDETTGDPTPPSLRNWMDWKLTIGRHRIYIDREGNSETHWAELYNRSGWDEFTKAWEYCLPKTAKKVFLSNMLEVLK